MPPMEMAAQVPAKWKTGFSCVNKLCSNFIHMNTNLRRRKKYTVVRFVMMEILMGQQNVMLHAQVKSTGGTAQGGNHLLCINMY